MIVGILGLHVDDCVCGGKGRRYQQARDLLKKRFPFRRWTLREGRFVGSFVKQNEDYSITISQTQYADGLRPLKIPRGADLDAAIPLSLFSKLRGLHGALGWLAGQSRPDLSFGTSRSQQSFPSPTWHDIVKVNNTVRRAKQYRDLSIKVQAIQPQDVVLIGHSDSSLLNMGEGKTQAGWVLGISSKALLDGREAPWAPLL